MIGSLFHTLTKFLLIILLCLFFAPIAHAQEDDPSLKTTGEEQAIFAYFKLLNKSPDYERWISFNPTYKALSGKKQEKFLIQENLRLGRGFGLYDIEHDPLIITIDVNAQILPPTEDAPAKFNMEFLGVNIDDNQLPSFAFPYGSEEQIVLVVFELAKLSGITLNAKQFASISEKTDEFNSFFPAKLTLHIRPHEADGETPVQSHDDQLLWLMSGKIAYMRCSFDDLRSREYDKQLWDYVAPWYKDIYDEKNIPEEEKYPDPFAHLKKD